MKTLILLISVLLVAFLLYRIVYQSKNKGESKLSVFEHPSTFKKPDIEMVVQADVQNNNIENEMDWPTCVPSAKHPAIQEKLTKEDLDKTTNTE